MPRYKAAFEDGMIELPRDAEILADHRALVMEQGVVRLPEQRTTSIKGKRRHGDAAIAGALAYFASQVEAREFNYQPAPAVRHFEASPTDQMSPRADPMRRHAEPDQGIANTKRKRFGVTAGTW
jgi:phage FluMu gp28-like protein